MFISKWSFNFTETQIIIMGKIDLKEDTMDRLPEWMPDDLYHNIGSDTRKGELIFFTHIFKDGSTLGFWTHSPWGTCHDMEQGWMVVSKNMKCLSRCASKVNGKSSKRDVVAWKKKQRTKHGKMTKLMEEWSGELIWKISDN